MRTFWLLQVEARVGKVLLAGRCSGRLVLASLSMAFGPVNHVRAGQVDFLCCGVCKAPPTEATPSPHDPLHPSACWLSPAASPPTAPVCVCPTVGHPRQGHQHQQRLWLRHVCTPRQGGGGTRRACKHDCVEHSWRCPLLPRDCYDVAQCDLREGHPHAWLRRHVFIAHLALAAYATLAMQQMNQQVRLPPSRAAIPPALQRGVGRPRAVHICCGLALPTRAKLQ